MAGAVTAANPSSQFSSAGLSGPKVTLFLNLPPGAQKATEVFARVFLEIQQRAQAFPGVTVTPKNVSWVRGTVESSIVLDFSQFLLQTPRDIKGMVPLIVPTMAGVTNLDALAKKSGETVPGYIAMDAIKFVGGLPVAGLQLAIMSAIQRVRDEANDQTLIPSTAAARALCSTVRAVLTLGLSSDSEAPTLPSVGTSHSPAAAAGSAAASAAAAAATTTSAEPGARASETGPESDKVERKEGEEGDEVAELWEEEGAGAGTEGRVA